MFRVFLKQALSVGESFGLPVQEEKHLLQVLREKEGAFFSVVDQNQAIFLAEIKAVKPYLICQAVQRLEEERKLPVEITVFQGIVKGEKWDFLLQKLTELGVHEIVPLVTEYGVVKWTKTDLEKKRQRFEKILEAAAMQSKRVNLPHLASVVNFKEFLQGQDDYDIVFACYEKEDALSLKTFLDRNHFLESVQLYKKPLRLAFLVGAEGGISPEEIKLLKEANISSVHLGHRILRAETAAIYVLAALGFYVEA